MLLHVSHFRPVFDVSGREREGEREREREREARDKGQGLSMDMGRCPFTTTHGFPPSIYLGQVADDECAWGSDPVGDSIH
jgi:hypothetical protein